MNNLVIDAISEKIFLTLISDKNVYTCCHENSKNNFEKLIILKNKFLDKNKSSFNIIDSIYVNRGPGSFAGIRNSLSIVKGLFWTKEIDYGEGSASNPGFPDMPNWFRDNRDWDKIIEGLKKYGFSSMEIDKIKGENWLQFFRKSFTTE